MPAAFVHFTHREKKLDTWYAKAYIDRVITKMLSKAYRRVMPSVYELIIYETAAGRIPIKEFLKELGRENQREAVAKIYGYLDLLKEHGMQINNYRSNAIKKVDENNNIWELRPGDNRVFFFHFSGNKLVLLHAFKKKGQKTPPPEIKQAIREMKDYRRRNTDGGHNV